MANGLPRQIFSVTEMGSGDVCLSFNALNFETALGDRRIVENRVSVHVSPSSPGRIIKRTILLSDGSKHTVSSYTVPPKERFRQHVISTACSNLADEVYDTSVHPRDTAHVVAWNVPPESTLVFHVFAGSKNVDFPQIREAALLILQLKKFRIATYANFVNLPGFIISRSMSLATSPPQLNGSPTRTSLSGNGVPSLTEEDIPKFIWQANEELSGQKAKRIAESLNLSIESFKDFKRIYSREPVRSGDVIVMGTPATGPLSWETPLATVFPS